MNNLDKILKDAVEGYEAPYDAAMWGKISNNLNPMEDAFRDSVDSFEAPYNPKAWSAIKNKIGSSSNVLQWITGSAAAIGLITGAVLFIPNENINNSVESVSRTDVSKNATEKFTAHKKTTNKLNVALLETDESESARLIETDSQEEISAVSTDNSTFTEQITDDNIVAIDNDNIGLNSHVDHEQNSNELSNDNNSFTEPITNVIIKDTKLKADFSMSSAELCAGEEVLFNPAVIQKDVIYVWNFGDGNFSSESASRHVFANGGDFDVSLTLKDEKTNKVLATKSETITVHKLPAVNFSWDKTSDVIPTVNFISLSSEVSDWGWKINGKMISDKNQFEHTFREKGNYTVELSSKNSAGCENSSQQVIKIENDYNLLAPTAFTPNGDNVNDDFIPQVLRLADYEFTMVIYNQQGETVYQTNSANLPWDGQNINDNSTAANGAYIWMVTLKNGNGVIENYKGQVFLTR